MLIERNGMLLDDGIEGVISEKVIWNAIQVLKSKMEGYARDFCVKNFVENEFENELLLTKEIAKEFVRIISSPSDIFNKSKYMEKNNLDDRDTYIAVVAYLVYLEMNLIMKSEMEDMKVRNEYPFNEVSYEDYRKKIKIDLIFIMEFREKVSYALKEILQIK
jgi:hypothetical protein